MRFVTFSNKISMAYLIFNIMIKFRKIAFDSMMSRGEFCTKKNQVSKKTKRFNFLMSRFHTSILATQDRYQRRVCVLILANQNSGS